MLGSSFEQTMMGWGHKCYIPSFVKIGLAVLEKKIFEWYLQYTVNDQLVRTPKQFEHQKLFWPGSLKFALLVRTLDFFKGLNF